MNTTFVMIKPDALDRGLDGQIQNLLTRRVGALVYDRRMLWLSQTEAEELYQEHRNSPYFSGLVEYTISGNVILLWLILDPTAEKSDRSLVERVREVIGDSNPEKRKPDTIRGMFALDRRRNSIHASDGPEAAKRELKLMFGATNEEIEVFS